MTTPTTPDGLQQFDHLPPLEAAYQSWVTLGINPEWHRLMKEQLHNSMPLLARALDREERRRAESGPSTEVGTG